MRILGTLVFCLFLFSPAQATVINVPGDYATIQRAIYAATHGDTVLVAPGTYLENLDFLGKAITVKVNGAPGSAVIDGGQPVDPYKGSTVAFESYEGPDSVLEGFTLINGIGTREVFPNSRMGGGVYCKSSSPTLILNTIQGNRANYGGGIYCGGGSPEIKTNLIESNEAYTFGSGIYCINAQPNIAGNTIANNTGEGIYFDGNSAGQTTDNIIRYNDLGIFCDDMSSPQIEGNEINGNHSATYSGGIHIRDESSPIILKNLIAGNESINGGGIGCFNDSMPVIEENTISGNEAKLEGGGIFCDHDSFPIIKNNIVQSNLSSTGGGISCRSHGAEIIGNTIYQNTALVNGGGIECQFVSNLKIWDNVVRKNTAEQGAGLGITGCSNQVVSLKNNIFDNNAAFSFYGSKGGGILLASSKVHLTGNLFKQNTVMASGYHAKGGGIFCVASEMALENCRFVTNHAMYPYDAYGGAIYGESSTITMTHCTVMRNVAESHGYGGGGCFVGCIVSVVNSIFWDNEAANDPQMYGSGITATYSDIQGGWAGDGNIDADPSFVDAQDGDLHLRFESPCRDSGLKNHPGLPTEDFEGDPRITSGEVDMGADEFHPHLYWTGIPAPQNEVHAMLIGWPGTSPVHLWFGTGVLDPPVQTSYGQWFLAAPVIGPVPLAPIPPSGVQSLSAVLPVGIPPPYSVPMQATIGNKLTNLSVLEVSYLQ